jgi:hypothetical protein
VWSARQVTAATPKSLSIDLGAARPIAWEVDKDGNVTRTDANGPQRWPAVGGRLAFEWDGAALTARGADAGADRVGGLRLPSQLRLAEPGAVR